MKLYLLIFIILVPIHVSSQNPFVDMSERLLDNSDENIIGNSVVSGDINGDNLIDYITADTQSNIKIYLQNQNQTYSLNLTIDINSFAALALDDIDQDNDLDLIAGCNGGRNFILINKGDGSFEDPIIINQNDIPSGTEKVLLIDINQDNIFCH